MAYFAGTITSFRAEVGVLKMSRPNKKRERNICVIEHCRSYREADMWPEPLTFHEFPADLNRRKQWLQVFKDIFKHLLSVSLKKMPMIFICRSLEEKIGYQEIRQKYVEPILLLNPTESVKLHQVYL